MTLKELYTQIEGNYDQAMRVLRVERLVDKHIRKLVGGGVVTRIIDASTTLDPQEMFDAAHAAKGVCGNLGLAKLADAASDLAEEFRPGNPRRYSDDEVRERVAEVERLYALTVDGIHRYEQG